ncbi:MAG TPA: phosphatase PAP2 family protein [Nitrospiraceae bacterium]|nr:phosphatase PAP2 family protein [Nitrospiraceae bacterium]
MDETLFRAINGLAERAAIVDWLMLTLAQSSNLFLPGVLVFFYWLWLDKHEALVGSVVLTGVIIVNDFIGAQVKHLVARPRPCRVLDHIHQLAGCGGTFSFPSNHAMNTAAAAAFAQMLYPSSGWVTWPLVALIGFSRVYVGAHYLTDVIGAWALGGGIGIVAGWALLRWSKCFLNRAKSNAGEGTT